MEHRLACIGCCCSFSSMVKIKSELAGLRQRQREQAERRKQRAEAKKFLPKRLGKAKYPSKRFVTYKYVAYLLCFQGRVSVKDDGL